MKYGWVSAFFCVFTLSAQTPVVTEGSVVNAASFTAGQVVTAGSLVSIFGTELSSGLAQADSIPLAISLNNVSVTFNNVSAPLLFVSGGQINAQLPWNVLPAGSTAGTVNVVVTRSGVSSQPRQVQVGTFSPGIFAVGFGVGQAIVINNSDGTLAAPVGSIQGLTTHPAKVGEFVQIWGTGLGAVDVPAVNGDKGYPPVRNTLTKPAVLLGGVMVPAEDVTFSGLQPEFVGVNQVNIKIPTIAPKGGKVTLQLQVGGITSTDKVTMAIE